MTNLRDAILKRKSKVDLKDGGIRATVLDVTPHMVREALQEMKPELVNEIKAFAEELIVANAELFKGEPGEPGEPGTSPKEIDEEKIIAKLKKELPDELDEEKILKKLAKKLPKINDIVSLVLAKLPDDEDADDDNEQEEVEEIDYDKLAQEIMPRIKDKGLDVKDIKGLEQMLKNWQSRLAASGKKGIIKGGGDTVVAGANVTITRLANGQRSIAATSGGGVSWEVPGGAIDDSNVTFVVSNPPVFIIVNGGIYRVGNGMFASYAAGTITLSSPVGSTGFIVSAY